MRWHPRTFSSLLLVAACACTGTAEERPTQIDETSSKLPVPATVTAPTPAPSEPAPVLPESEPLQYRVVEREDISYAGTPRMAYRVILSVDEIPSKERIEKVGSRIWEDGNRHWAEFTVFFYLPEMNTGWTAYAVGEFRPAGLLELNLNDSALLGTRWLEGR